MYLLKMEKALNIGFLIEIIKKQFSIVEEHSIGVKHIGDQILVLSLTSCFTSYKLLNLSELQFSYL